MDAEQLLVALLLLGAERGARLLVEGGGLLLGLVAGAAPSPARTARAACARASSRRTAGGASRRRAPRCSCREALPSAARPAPARWSGGGPACGSAAPRARTRSRTRGPWRRASSSPARRAGARARPPPPRAARRPTRRTRTRRSRATCGPGWRRTQAAARSANLAMFTSRSSDSELVLNRCCLRSPIRSIRRCTNRSGRISSNARQALRCSLRKFSMRVRALGRDVGRLERGAQPGDHVGLAPPRDRSCSARGRPGRARPAGASARARPRARPAGRPAGAARRAGRAPRSARRSPRRPTSR